MYFPIYLRIVLYRQIIIYIFFSDRCDISPNDFTSSIKNKFTSFRDISHDCSIIFFMTIERRTCVCNMYVNMELIALKKKKKHFKRIIGFSFRSTHCKNILVLMLCLYKMYILGQFQAIFFLRNCNHHINNPTYTLVYKFEKFIDSIH